MYWPMKEKQFRTCTFTPSLSCALLCVVCNHHECFAVTWKLGNKWFDFHFSWWQMTNNISLPLQCSNWDEPAQRGEGIMQNSTKHDLSKTTISPRLWDELPRASKKKELRMTSSCFFPKCQLVELHFIKEHKFKVNSQCNPETELSYKYTPSSPHPCTARLCFWAGYTSQWPVTRNKKGSQAQVRSFTAGEENTLVLLRFPCLRRQWTEEQERSLMEKTITDQLWYLGHFASL